MSKYHVNGRKLCAYEIKAELVDGVNIDTSALPGVGEKYKEQIKGVFDANSSTYNTTLRR
jgi:hypothetical protein